MMSVKSKNIHVLPTDKPSRLHVDLKSTFLTPNYQIGKEINSVVDSINIYITSDEEIKEGDWCFYVNSIYKVLRISSNNKPIIKMSDGTFEISYYKKIILTTDQDLIKDGVQAIDDEFLEWFVKNPSCEDVETVFNNRGITGAEKILKTFGEYQIIIPKEEPKQDLEKEMFELEQELDIPSNLRWHNSKPKQETLEEVIAKEFQLNSSTEIKDEKYVYLIDKHRFKIAVNNILKWQQERMYSELSIYLQQKADEDRLKSLTSNQIRAMIEQFKNK